MDARDLCRRLGCSPLTLARWVEGGCPVHRQPRYAWYDLAEVEAWLAARGVTEWPKEDDRDLDVPLRCIAKALERKEITPWQAEQVIFLLGAEYWA